MNARTFAMSMLATLLAVLTLASSVRAGVVLEAPDFPFAWYLRSVEAKITERWVGKTIPGRQPVATFEISRDGRVSGLAIEKPSGNPYYDQAALRAITEAAPFPPLPPDFSAATLQVKMEFAFVMERDQLAAEEERHRKDEQAERERRRLEQERLRQAEEQRRREITAKPWPDDIKRAVIERKVQIGMTSEQVRLAWGRPEKINETIRETRRDEQWIYPGASYLYFTNGTLTTIQRTR